jgi:hypothetical protein
VSHLDPLLNILYLEAIELCQINHNQILILEEIFAFHKYFKFIFLGVAFWHPSITAPDIWTMQLCIEICLSLVFLTYGSLYTMSRVRWWTRQLNAVNKFSLSLNSSLPNPLFPWVSQSNTIYPMILLLFNNFALNVL